VCPLTAIHRAVDAIGVVLTTLWCLGVVVFGSDAGLHVYVVLGSTWGALPVLVIWACRSAWQAYLERAWLRRWRRVVAEPAAMALCFTVVWTGLAFHGRFLLSLPALDSFVRNHRPVLIQGEPAGQWVGLFRVTEAEVLPGGVVRLVTTRCMFDHCGVVYSPAGEPPRVGEDYYSPLYGGWWQWLRSW
jgi:hypothetical protein